MMIASINAFDLIQNIQLLLLKLIFETRSFKVLFHTTMERTYGDYYRYQQIYKNFMKYFFEYF